MFSKLCVFFKKKKKKEPKVFFMFFLFLITKKQNLKTMGKEAQNGVLYVFKNYSQKQFKKTETKKSGGFA